MTEQLNKEISLVVDGPKVVISTQRKLAWKEALLFPIPHLIVFSIVFGLKKDPITAVGLGLVCSLFISFFFLGYRFLTGLFYWHFEFNTETKSASKKSYRLGKLKKELPLIWNDEQLYFRDVSRSGWKSCILTYIPDLDKEEILSLIVVKQETTINRIQELLQLPYREKRNEHAFFDN